METKIKTLKWRYVLVEDRDVHLANNQFATLCFDLSMLPSTMSRVELKHVDLKNKKGAF